MYNTRFVPIYTIGFLEIDVPAYLMKLLRSEVDEMVSSNFKEDSFSTQYLASNIENEYYLRKTYPQINDFIGEVAPEYWKYYGNKNLFEKKHTIPVYENNNKPSLWVNFQKKGEVNPVHNHTGDLSFVIYVKIPYTFEDEHKTPSNINSNAPSSGVFQFMYCDQYVEGGISTFNVPTDKNYEGKMILFSSKLNHMVYPFYTSDEYRITIAGNIQITR